MDSLQKQVTDLSTKLDALYQITEELSQRVAQVLPPQSAQEKNGSQSLVSTSYYQYSKRNRSLNNSMEHKDVLVDESLDATHKSGEKQLAPEIQIQRLTAQLTAAYNRIAILEEQLLAQRTH